jgi:hypothetical protein
VGKLVHRLTEVDPVERTAVCAHCGPVTIRRMGSGRDVWRCNKKDRRERSRGRNQRKRWKPIGPPKPECERCGFKPESPRQMDRHHKNRNTKDNDPSNIAILCANCHRLVHAIEDP